MEKGNSYGWGVSLQVLYCLLMLPAVLQTSTAQSCPAGCSGCGTITVDCQSAGLTSFPQLPPEVQQSVQTLYLLNNNIESLEPNVLENYTSLINLQLQYNQLTSLPENLFSTTTQLTFLHLEYNQLTSLPENLFSTTTLLYFLYLFDNQLMSLPDKLLSATTRLDQLHLYNNQLTSLPEDLLNTTTQLTRLYLNNNQLTSLPENLLSTTPEIQFLYLYDNQLTSLPEGILTSLTAITHPLFLFIYSNPWNCDCELRGLPTLLSSVHHPGGIPTHCVTPANLNGVVIASLTEDQLICECTPPCVNGTCNITVGACECSDGYIGLNCSIATTCPMTFPVRRIEPSPATGSTAQCPSEQERSEVFDNVRADILTSVREEIVPLLQEVPEACKN